MMKQFLFSLLFLAGICPVLHAQIDWQDTNGPEGGSGLEIYYNSQFAFFPDAYNLYRTSDGLTWEKLPYRNLWPMAVSNNTLAAQQGAGFNYAPEPVRFVVSHDNGATWMEGTRPPTLYGTFTRIAVCSHGIYVSDGAQGKLFRTQDDGLTWDTIPPPGLYSYDLWAFEDKLYAEWYGHIWRLAANGTDWELFSPDLGPQEYLNGMYVAGPVRLFSTGINIWASVDDGVTWKKSAVSNGSNDNHFVALGSRIYKSGGNTEIVYTEDFGLTWLEYTQPGDYDLYSMGTAGGKLLYSSYNKGMFYLNETTQAFEPANEGLTSGVVYYLEAGNSELWAACGNGVFAYDLVNHQWVDKAPLPLPTADHYIQATVSQSGKIAASDWLADHFYLSQNNGLSWDTIYPFATLGGWGHVGKINWLGDVLLSKDETGFDIRSADLGQTWEYVTIPDDIVAFNGKYYGIGYNALYSSSDFGLTWQTEQGPNIPSYFTLMTSGDRLFLLGDSEWTSIDLYTSTDGATWHYAGDGLPNYIYSPPSSNYDVFEGNVWNHSGKYYLYHPSMGFFASLDTCKTWLPLQRKLYEHMAKVDTMFYSGGFGGGVVKTGLPQNYGSITSGRVFKDDNNNGIQDAGETALPNIQVNVKEPAAWYPFWFVTTQPDGHYAIGSTPGGGDTLRARVLSNYVENINPPMYIINGSGADRNFGIHFTQNITDVTVAGYHHGRPRPGFDLNTSLYYTNDGTLPANATVSLKLDPLIQFTTADPMPTAVFGGDSLVWNVAQLPLLAHQYIRVGGHVDQTVPLGSVVKTRGYITPDLPDFKPGNNSFVLIDTVVGSFDPNEKRVEPSAGLTADDIAAGKELRYTIQFQNTGTYEAERVRITDYLDTALNVTTLRLVASSHPVTSFRLLPGGLLEIVFDHIALPDSNSNEAASHGFVTFAIQRYKYYRPNFKILNKAAIYFDFNEPILTNTVTTKIVVATVATAEPKAETSGAPELLMSPNPTKRNFTATTDGKLKGSGYLEMVNMAGQVCYRQQVTDFSQPIQVSPVPLSDGMYMVRATGEQGQLTGKLVVQH